MKDYGNLIILETLMVILTPIIQFSVSGIVVEFFKLTKDEFKKYISNSLLIAIPAFIGSEVILFFAAEVIAEKFAVNHIWLYFLPIIVLLNLTIQTLTTIYQCEKNYKGYSFFLIGPNLISFILTILFLSIFELGWQSKLYAIAVSFLIFSFIALYILYKGSYISKNIQMYFVSLNLKFTLSLIPHTLAASLYFVADRLFISDMLGNASVAVYAAGMQLALIMSVVQNSISKAWNPFVLEFMGNMAEKQRDVSKEYKKLATFMFYGCSVVTIMSVVLATIINFSIVYLLPANYEQSKYLGMMLVGAFCLLGYYKIVSPILWFHKRSSALSKITLVVFFINLLLNYSLIPLYGVYGACYATIISILLQFVFTLLLVTKIASVHIKEDEFNEKPA
tara:strand:- start:11714 stop:12892 length:1179 start_codon:yes stop_codon:yes gene_type:complete